MFSSVKERRKNAPFFYKYYFDICRVRNVAPISLSKQHADKNILDFSGDKVSLNEWFPILEALKTDRSLHFIAVRSKYPGKKVAEEVDTEAKARLVKKYPVLYTRFILRLLMTSLSECIMRSSAVTCIELEGLPITFEYMAILSKDISNNRSLQKISFHNCPIGDEACEQLCKYIRNMPTVSHLDLSHCNLSCRSAVILGETLKCQSLQHYSESWKLSLRNHDPNLESMPGIRRIILNNNTQIGDEGIAYLMEILKEDVWLKAIDLQNCDISNVGAQCVLDMLDFNTTLYIVDVRGNEGIQDVLVHQIMLKLLYNNANKNAREYRWTVPQTQLSNITKTSIGLKNYISVSQTSHHGKPNKMKSCNSASSDTTQINSQSLLLLYLPQVMETTQQLKEVKQNLEIETSLRRKAEFEQIELRNKINELECELLKEKEEKEGFCLIKVEAFEAILDTLRKFTIFMKHIKDVNEMNHQGGYLDSDNRMQCSVLKAHAQNFLEVGTPEDQNELCDYLKNISQETEASLKIYEKRKSQTNKCDKCIKGLQVEDSSITEQDCGIVPNIPKEQPCSFKTKCEPNTVASAMQAETKLLNNRHVPLVLNNCSNSSSVSKFKELYEQFIDFHASKIGVIKKDVH